MLARSGQRQRKRGVRRRWGAVWSYYWGSRWWWSLLIRPGEIWGRSSLLTLLPQEIGNVSPSSHLQTPRDPLQTYRSPFSHCSGHSYLGRVALTSPSQFLLGPAKLFHSHAHNPFRYFFIRPCALLAPVMLPNFTFKSINQIPDKILCPVKPSASDLPLSFSIFFQTQCFHAAAKFQSVAPAFFFQSVLTQ